MVGHSGGRRPLSSGEPILKKRRPEYERREDREVERNIARRVGDKMGLSMVRMPRKYFFDFAGVKKKEVLAFIEVKSRSYPIHRIDPIFISVDKVTKMLNYSDVTGVDSYLAFRFEDGDFIFDMRPEMVSDLRVSIGGRVDRGDWQDIEPCFEIPAKLWRRT